MELPAEKTKGFLSLNELKILIYGPPKIGKSTFCSNIPHALFLTTEKGYGSLKIFKVDIENWQDYLDSIKILKQKSTQKKYKTIIIDTIDELYRFCLDYTCEDLGIKDPTDARWGKGYNQINRNFSKGITSLINIGYGIYFISHSKTEEIVSRSFKYTKIVPTMKNQARTVILPILDVIVYCAVINIEKGGNYIEKRAMIFKPTEELEVGDRTGRFPNKLPLNYKKFEKAYTKDK